MLCIVLLCPALLSCRTKRSPIETLEAFAAAYPLPAELGIFECPDRDAAAEIIGCLRARIDLCRAAGKTDTSAAADPTIALYGRTVVYTVLPDNEKAARVLSRLF